MGWASGSRLFSAVIETIKDNVPDEDARYSIYEGLVSAFEDADCDTLDECKGEDPAFDKLFEELYPTEEVEDDPVEDRFGWGDDD